MAIKTTTQECWALMIVPSPYSGMEPTSIPFASEEDARGFAATWMKAFKDKGTCFLVDGTVEKLEAPKAEAAAL